MAWTTSGTLTCHAGHEHLTRVAVHAPPLDSIIEHPAGLTRRIVDPEARLAAGITPGLLRLSVGLEDVDDLWADLDQALASSRRLAATP